MKSSNALLEEFGWYAHVVESGDKTPYSYNYHTHGFEGLFNHKNIQIVIPMPPERAHDFATIIVNEIKSGKRFSTGVDYPDLAGNGFMVRFIDAMECGRSVLRMLVPDKAGKYEGYFAKQLTMLDNNDGVPEKEKSRQVD